MEMRNKNNYKRNAVDIRVLQKILLARNRRASQIQPKERKHCRKKKALPPRKPVCNDVDATGKPVGSLNDFKPRCNDVDVTAKLKDSRHGNFCSFHELLEVEPFDFPCIPGGRRNLKGMHNRLLPATHTNDLPPVQDHGHVNASTDESSSVLTNTNESNVRSGIQTQPYSNDSTNFYFENIPAPMDLEPNDDSLNLGQAVSHDGSSRNISALFVSQNYSRNEICIGGSSYNHTGQFHFRGINCNTDLGLPPPAIIQQNSTFSLGHLISSTSSQHQQYRQQDRETPLNEPARLQVIPQQQNRNDDLVRVLGRVRSPEYADLTDRLLTFSRWPSVIEQTPAQVAEAGFYYTGFQDTVRCFVCDGGLKNWDPDDDPWIEHARWFPQCAYVRHVKGEEFINLVRLSSEVSDEEDDYSVHSGASWRGVENSNTSADSASHEVTEPSVLESIDAKIAIEMGFAEKDVAMAINDIFKKGKEDFTCQEIADIVLEKGTRGDPSNSTLDVDCLPSVGKMSATGHTMYENRSLKESLFCIECKSKERNILFLPCTHHVVCDSCSRDLHICTYCYRKIKDKVRTYMS